MATATTTKQVTGYTLELSKDEAEALLALTSYVCGGPSSPAKHTDAIYEALDDAGVLYGSPARKLITQPLYGATGIRFLNYGTNGTKGNS